MAFWRKNGSIVGVNGVPIRCDECPCGRICIIKVKSQKRRLLQGNYTLVFEAGDNYNCAMFEDDGNGGKTCMAVAEGTLVQAVERYEAVPQSVSTQPTYLVYGVTLKNTTSNQYITIGCQCMSNPYTYECTYSYVYLNDYCITGEVGVKTVPMEEYTIYDACEPDSCDAGETLLGALQSWYGGTLYNEGFYSTSYEGGSTAPTFQVFRKLWKYSYANNDGYSSVRHIALTCNCSIDENFIYEGEETANAIHRTIQLDGICDSSCQIADCLRAWGEDSGYQVYDEGFIVHLVTSSSWDGNDYTVEYGDWYERGDKTLCSVCVYDGIDYYYIGCGECNSYTSISVLSKQTELPHTGGESIPDDYYKYITFNGACSGIDERELILTEPDTFGITDISFGNNTKYTYSTTQVDTEMVEENGEWHSQEVYNTVTGYGICATKSDGDMYLDYRTLCYIQKVMQGSVIKYAIGYISPDGSPAGSNTSMSALYDSASFVGHLEPFTFDSDLDYGWTSHQVGWSFDDDGGTAIPKGYRETLEDAQEACANATPKSDVDVCGWSFTGNPSSESRISPPNMTMTLHSCEINEVQNGYGYNIIFPYYTIGVQRGNSWIVYQEEWIDTNRGLLRRGEGTYLESFVLYGSNDSHGSGYNQSGSGKFWGSCSYSYPVNTADMTITAQHVDESMHDLTGHDVVTTEYEIYNEGE